MIRKILCLGLLMTACTGEPRDSGIWVPNPEMTFKLALTETGDAPRISMAHVAQVDTLTLVDCDGNDHPFPFGEALSSDDDSVFSLETEALCVEQVRIDASDVDPTAALMLLVGRGEHTARLRCPAAVCFPMVFSGNIALSAEEDAPAHEVRWNVVPDPEFLSALEATAEYRAGDCGGDATCLRMEQLVTQEAELQERGASGDWQTAMTVP